ncbi:MAG: hypothetical protein E7415_01030 [Ruminococcaceae bacterium]|nr:hypothetical protein [Oscillospiraceae bacterium]
MTDSGGRDFFMQGTSLLGDGEKTSDNPFLKAADNGIVPEQAKSFDKSAPATEVRTSVAERKVGSNKAEVELKRIAVEAVDVLEKAGLTSYSNEIRAIFSESKSQRFTVSVVGEFSRGKSTFINKLLARDILPVANMPTTAMLTRIRHSEKEGITIYDVGNKTKKSLALSVTSWENYVADDNGNDPSGVAFVGVNSPWLEKGIEIIDTPGAGDLEAGRAKLIGDALKSSDGAVITISALSALSMSEKVFIEERLISKKTPFLMLIVTKLDQVDVKQRNGVVDYIKEKLKMWKFNGIDVFIPYEIEMPDNKYKNIMGMDKITKHINSWMVSSERKALTLQWTALKLNSHLQSVIDYAKERQCLAGEENLEKKQQLLDKKSRMIEDADRVWDETKIRMIKKCDECYDMFLGKVADYKESLVEKMQYEVSHSSNPQKWWKDDFPYRLKIEMTNLSNNIEALVSRAYTKDTAWFNSVLEKNFKMGVLAGNDEIADKEHYAAFDAEADIELNDLSKGRMISRIGLTALSIGAAMGCMAIGVTPIFATMGLGTGGSIVSETIFKKKSENQKRILKDEIGRRIPIIVDNATSYSEKRIKAMYSNVISEATKQQEKWVESQKSVVLSAKDEMHGDSAFNASALIHEMKTICDKIEFIISD